MSKKHVSFKAIVSNISLVDNPWGEKSIRIDLTEERELPGPILVQPGRKDSTLAKEVMPIISQVLRSMPGLSINKVRIPRLTIYLTEDEWDKIIDKPHIGDVIIVSFYNNKVDIKKQ